MKPSSLVLDCGSSVVVTSGWSSMITTPTMTRQEEHVFLDNKHLDEKIPGPIVSDYTCIYLLA